MAIFRLGSAIPTPGVSYPNVQQCLTMAGGTNDLLGLVNLFSGGALLQLSIFALGIMPYITASIKIGRASCRERGEAAGVAGPLTARSRRGAGQRARDKENAGRGASRL